MVKKMVRIKIEKGLEDHTDGVDKDKNRKQGKGRKALKPKYQ